MNQPRHRAKLILFILCSLLLNLVSSIAAQEDAPVPVAFAETDTGVTLYAVSPEKTLESVGKLPTDFGTDSRKTTWMIRNNFVVSPDEQQLAFTAQKGGNDSRVALYVFSLTDQTVRQVFEEDYIGYFLHLKWSPDSQNLLIEPEVEDNCGCMGRAEVRVFNLVSGTFLNLTDSSRDLAGGSFTWAVNNRDLVYAGNGVNIVEIRQDGIRRQPLVNFEMNPPSDSFLSSCNFAWSEQRARWYYVVGCAWDDPLDSLYSVDLSGHARIEADIPNLLRKEFPLPLGYEPYVEDINVTIIHPTESTVYAAFGFKAWVPKNSDPSADIINQAFWRVIRLNEPGEIKTVFEFTAPESLLGAAFTHDNQKVALADGPHLVIADLITGEQIAYLTRTLESYYPRTDVLTDVLWIDNQRLSYTADNDVWLLDTSDGTSTNLTADIATKVFLLPQTNSY